jgi:hypothetical protein
MVVLPKLGTIIASSFSLTLNGLRRGIDASVYCPAPASLVSGSALAILHRIALRRAARRGSLQTWHALNLLSRESMKTFQELADEAFRNLLHKYKRPTDLKAALRESAKGVVSGRRRPQALIHLAAIRGWQLVGS